LGKSVQLARFSDCGFYFWFLGFLRRCTHTHTHWSGFVSYATASRQLF